MINHAENPNCGLLFDAESEGKVQSVHTMSIVTVRPLRAGQEVTLQYLKDEAEVKRKWKF
jgi:SET domain-containing protein